MNYIIIILTIVDTFLGALVFSILMERLSRGEL
jgi:hypothetical protein